MPSARKIDQIGYHGLAGSQDSSWLFKKPAGAISCIPVHCRGHAGALQRSQGSAGPACRDRLRHNRILGRFKHRSWSAG
jgi:hypothetical protein